MNDVIYYSGSDWIILYDVPNTLARTLLLKMINLFVFYDLWYYLYSMYCDMTHTLVGDMLSRREDGCVTDEAP